MLVSPRWPGHCRIRLRHLRGANRERWFAGSRCGPLKLDTRALAAPRLVVFGVLRCWSDMSATRDGGGANQSSPYATQSWQAKARGLLHSTQVSTFTVGSVH